MSLRRSFNFIIMMAVAAAWTSKAPASSCCAGGGGQSICVLPYEQRYQIGVTSTYRFIEGEFDPYGNYTRNAEGYSFRQITTVVGGAYRLGEDWQAGLSVPVITNQQTISGNSRSATALGDPAIEARYTLFEDLAFLRFRPQITFYGGVRLPLGNSIYDSRDPYSLDVVGDGTTTFHAGINASKLYRPVKFTLDSTFFYPTERTVNRMRGAVVPSPYQLRTGNRFQFVESVTDLLNSRWSGVLGLRQLWVSQSSINGNAGEGSAQRLFSSLAAVNYFLENSWAFALNYETAFPFFRYLANQPNAQSVALAMTYGGF